MRWSNDEFERAAESTRLGENTLAACRDVLVEGMTGAGASKVHDIRPPHISRGIKILTEKLAELREHEQESFQAQKVAGADITVAELYYEAAKEAAQSIKGAGWLIRNAEADHVYTGPGVVKVGGYFVQETGRVGVIHNLQDLSHEPALGTRLEIAYNAIGKALVSELTPQVTQQQGAAIGR